MISKALAERNASQVTLKATERKVVNLLNKQTLLANAFEELAGESAKIGYELNVLEDKLTDADDVIEDAISKMRRTGLPTAPSKEDGEISPT